MNRGKYPHRNDERAIINHVANADTHMRIPTIQYRIRFDAYVCDYCVDVYVSFCSYDNVVMPTISFRYLFFNSIDKL